LAVLDRQLLALADRQLAQRLPRPGELWVLGREPVGPRVTVRARGLHAGSVGGARRFRRGTACIHRVPPWGMLGTRPAFWPSAGRELTVSGHLGDDGRVAVQHHAQMRTQFWDTQDAHRALAAEEPERARGLVLDLPLDEPARVKAARGERGDDAR